MIYDLIRASDREIDKLIIADGVAQYYVDNYTENDAPDPKELGRFKLPFPECFVEFKCPEAMQTKKGKVNYDEIILRVLEEKGYEREFTSKHINSFKPERLAISLVQDEVNKETEEISIFARLYALMADGRQEDYYTKFKWYIITDLKGYIKKAGFEAENGHSKAEVKETATELVSALYTAMMAICLINCRNIELIEKDTRGKRHRSENKPRGSLYYVLGVKPMAKRYSNNGHEKSDGETKIKKRFHYRRGHFRDYSESGLFGKYHDVFWFGSTSVGSIELGEITKAYEVEPPNNHRS